MILFDAAVHQALATDMWTNLISYSEHLLNGGHICRYSQVGFLARNDVQ